MISQRISREVQLMYPLAAILLVLITASAGAQAQIPRFKVGDHVEFSENSACLGGPNAVQATGNIVKVNPGIGGTYVIELDSRPGTNVAVPIYYDKCGMRATAAQKKHNDTTDGGGTGRADNNGQPANNQNDNAANQGGAQFKQGDRVEFSQNAACLDTQYAIPTKGTIVAVNAGATSRNYVILADPLAGQAPRQMTIPMAREECGIRALGGPAPKIQVDKLRVDKNNTVLADRELLDCEHLKHDGRNGSPPPVELLKKLIRCLYEKPSPVGQDGATTMDITEFTVGTPHRWRLYEDMGQGTANTLVYPVHVKWNMKTFYRTRNVQVTGKEGTFTCFVDATNLWQCGSAAGPHKDGTTQEIMVKKE
ncbi:MAG: hypothetical protein JOZ57_08430 [Abitibacteriaceae bacterium]|nr:hypothetical protein [Abditibacteriaceae bacterium]